MLNFRLGSEALYHFLCLADHDANGHFWVLLDKIQLVLAIEGGFEVGREAVHEVVAVSRSPGDLDAHIFFRVRLVDNNDNIITFLVNSLVVVVLYRLESKLRLTPDHRLRNTRFTVGSCLELHTNYCVLGICKIISHLLFHLFVSLCNEIEKLILIVVKPVFLAVI